MLRARGYEGLNKNQISSQFMTTALPSIPRIKPQMILLVDYDSCSGCQSCVLMCSLIKTGIFSPSRSRVTIKKWEDQCLNIPIICEHCNAPPCATACPATAIRKNPETGIVEIDQELCIGCKACATACPYGSDTVHFINDKAVLCDLCAGNPQCSRICQQKAIAYMPTTIAAQHKKRRLAENRRKVLQLPR